MYNEITKKYLYQKYIIDKKSMAIIAKESKCSQHTIRCRLIKFNITIRVRRTNLKNQKYGLLTALYVLPNRNKYQRFIWQCKCKCGNMTQVSISNWKKIKSCGCLKKIIGKNNKGWKGYKEISGRYWGLCKKNAQQRKLKFNITINYVWRLFLKQNRQCALSNIPIHFYKSRQNYRHQSASLDRIDSSKGYIKNNIQWVHKDINRLKSNFNENDFKKLCYLVAINDTNNELDQQEPII
jgi:hypothetical protein